MFNVHIQSKLVEHACHGHINGLCRFLCPGQEKKKGGGGGGGGPSALAGTREYEQSNRNR